MKTLLCLLVVAMLPFSVRAGDYDSVAAKSRQMAEQMYPDLKNPGSALAKDYAKKMAELTAAGDFIARSPWAPIIVAVRAGTDIGKMGKADDNTYMFAYSLDSAANLWAEALAPGTDGFARLMEISKSFPAEIWTHPQWPTILTSAAYGAKVRESKEVAATQVEPVDTQKYVQDFYDRLNRQEEAKRKAINEERYLRAMEQMSNGMGTFVIIRK